MYPVAIKIRRGRIHLYFWGDRGIPKITVLEAEESLTEQMAESPYCDWPRGPGHPGHRLPQERIFQGPERTYLGFWDSCCGHRKLNSYSSHRRIYRQRSNGWTAPSHCLSVHQKHWGYALFLAAVCRVTDSHSLVSPPADLKSSKSPKIRF